MVALDGDTNLNALFLMNPPDRVTHPLAWLWRHPLLLVILANLVFSLGIWNAQDGYGEDMGPVKTALYNIQTQSVNGDLYVKTFTLFLNGITPDPVHAGVLMRFLVSLFTSVSLYLVLSCFSNHLGRGCILFVCFVWTASYLNAPAIQSTSASGFAFGVMMLGIYCLLGDWSVAGAIGFYFFGLTAASLRPEYMAPVLLMTALFIVIGVLKCTTYLEALTGFPRFKMRLGVLFLMLIIAIGMIVHPSRGVRKKMQYCDRYLFYGFGQCYADFYRREHPLEIFDPMTEWEWLLKRDFGDPKNFTSILRNNPRESARYFFLNTVGNIAGIPRQLFITRDKGAGIGDKRLYRLVLTLLIFGGLLGIGRLRRLCVDSLGENRAGGWRARLNLFFQKRKALLRKILILFILTSASSAAIVMLVPTPRYWISIVPLLYVILAFAVDCLLKQLRLLRFEPCMVALSFVGFCSPNFIVPHPCFEVRALQHIAPLVRDHPVIGAWWAQPECVFAFRGDARDISISDGINAGDIIAGRFDILSIDGNFRGTGTWLRQHEFFEDFVNEPEKYGFKKVTDVPTGRFSIFYRPKPVAQ